MQNTVSVRFEEGPDFRSNRLAFSCRDDIPQIRKLHFVKIRSCKKLLYCDKWKKRALDPLFGYVPQQFL